MTIIGDAFIAVKPDPAGFGPQTEKSVLGSVGSIAKKAAVLFGGVFAAQKAGQFLTGAVADAREANAINRQTEAVIKSTGGVANVTQAEIEKLNSALQSTTGISDDAINEGQNLLLTFTNIKNGVGDANRIFDRASTSLVDMAAAMGQDPKNAAIQLGKALNDPIAGISSLGRAGVQFTDQQKEQIKWLVENGRTMDAQKIILKELETQFGGSAAAQADASKILGATLADLQEEVGQRLLPVIDFLATQLNNVLPLAFDAVGAGFGFLKRAAEPVVATFQTVAGYATQLFDVLFRGDFRGGPLSEDSPIVDVAFRVRDAIGEIFGIAKQVFGVIFAGDFRGGVLAEDSPIIDGAFKVRDAFKAVFDAYVQYLGWVFGTAIPAAAEFLTGTVIPGVVSAIGSLVDGFQGKGGEGSFFTDLGEAIRNVVDFVVDDAIPAFEEHLLPVIERLIEFVKANAKPILITLGVALAALAAPVLTAVAAFIYMYQRFEIVRDIVATVVGAFTGFIGFLTTTVAPFVQQVAGAIGGHFATLSAAIGERMGAITEAIGHIVEVLKVVLAVVLGVFIGPLILAWQQFGDDIMAIIQIAWDQVQNIVATAIGILTALIDTALALINGDFGAAWNAIKEIPRIAFEYIVETVRNLLEVAKTILGAAWETIKSVATGAWNAVKDQVTGTVQGLVDGIRGKIDGIVEFFGNVPERLARGGRRMFDWIKTAFESAINFVIRAWNRLEFKIPGFDPPGPGPKFGGFTLGLPQIDPVRLAEGGLIRGRPGSGILAQIGEATRPTNEAVLPLPDAVVRGLARIADGGGLGETVQLVMPAGIGESNAVAVAVASVRELRSDKWRRRK